MIPQVDFFGTSVSRLILGDNPFGGHSYIGQVHTGDEMMDFYTAEKCVETLFEAEENGITGYMALADPFILRVIRQYKNEGGKMKIMFQTYAAMELDINLAQLVKCDPIAVYHQGTTADYYTETDQVDVLKTRLKRMKEYTGLPIGLGTHVPETVLRAEEEDWGVDFYMTCLYNARRTQRGQQSGWITGKPKELVFYPEDRFLMFEAIRKVQKPCIAFKLFAGGQRFMNLKPEEVPVEAERALREAFENIKPGDLGCIGVFQKYKNQLKENCDLAKKIFSENHV